MSNSAFTDIVKVVQTLSEQVAHWRNDNNARHLHSKQDFKTEADRRAHAFLKSELSNLYPDIPVISEEDEAHLSTRPTRYWLIDPIDGTASWYGGFSGFVSQVALVENAEPIFGVVVAPVLNKTWTALKNGGAFLNNAPLKSLKSSSRLVFVDNTPEPHGFAKDLMSSMNASGYYESGSIGLKSCLVADGTVDLFIKPVVVRDWDIAPVAVILKEVGGFLRLTNGSPFIFEGPMDKPEGIIIARDQVLLERAIKCADQRC